MYKLACRRMLANNRNNKTPSRRLRFSQSKILFLTMNLSYPLYNVGVIGRNKLLLLCKGLKNSPVTFAALFICKNESKIEKSIFNMEGNFNKLSIQFFCYCKLISFIDLATLNKRWQFEYSLSICSIKNVCNILQYAAIYMQRNERNPIIARYKILRKYLCRFWEFPTFM